MYNFQITSGVDVAQSLENSYLKSLSDNSSTYSLSSLEPTCSELGKMVALNEDEALKIILANTKQNEIMNSKQQDLISTASTRETESCQEVLVNNTSSTINFINVKSEEKTNTNTFEEPSSVGNSLNRQSGWSFDENQNDSIEAVVSTTINRNVGIEGKFIFY